MVRLVPVVLSVLLLAAHFLRQAEGFMVLTVLSSLGLLATRQRFSLRVFSLALPAASLVWVHEAFEIARLRIALGQPWLRMALILGAVTALTAGSGLVLRSHWLRERYSRNARSAGASTAAFFFTAIVLTTVQLKVPRPMLLADRFFSGSGALEILLLSTYAAWIAGRFADGARSAETRRVVWLLFCLVFFAQLALGLAADRRFLMASTPHLPVPALIVAGPLYRGEGWFMPVLFSSTLLLVGPAWCSHLCYIGAIDHELSRLRKRPRTLPRWTGPLRVGLLVAVVGTALSLRALGAEPVVAGGLAALLGAVGLLVMLFVSSRLGVMTHCTVYCPMGLVAVVLGKVSPFRMKIAAGCTDCSACGRACRYDALRPSHVAKRSPGFSCTLCGDCTRTCPSAQIHYAFFGLSATRARLLFAASAASLAAIFLGLARL